MAKKTKYFDVERFVSEVIRDMKFGKIAAPVEMELRGVIEAQLGDRIMATIINSFQEKEMQLFNNILKDHPELDEIDAVMMVAPNVPGLSEKLERNINSLYRELVYDAEHVELAMKDRKKNITK